MIPKTIHQTHRNLPKELLSNANSIQQQNSDYHYRFWTDEEVHDFVRDEYGSEIFSAYLSINPRYGPARADLFRYLCIYRYGGVYLDIKSSTEIPFSQLLRPDDSYILAQWRRKKKRWPWSKPKKNDPALDGIGGGEFQQWHVIAEAGHPYLAAVIESVLRNIRAYDPKLHGVGKLATLHLTGPVAYTLAIHPIRELHAHRFVTEGLVYQSVDHIKVMSRTTPHYAGLTEPIVLR